VILVAVLPRCISVGKTKKDFYNFLNNKKREESFPFSSTVCPLWKREMKLDFNDFQKAKLLLSYKLTRLGREVNKVNPVF
jgi:hypothetical protein